MALSPEEQELWQRLRGHGDREAQEVLFAKYSPWARSIAREVYRRVRITQLDWGDYSQNATIGLLEAMARYDHSRNIDFIAYAKPRVRGSVFNGLRAYLTENRHSTLFAKRQAERCDSLIESGDGDGLEQFVSLVSGLAFGYLLDSLGESEFVEQPLHVSHQMDAQKVGLRLREAVRQLPEKEGVVVGMHYLQHVPFVEIARLLGVTKGRVSQIHKSAIGRLRTFSVLEDFRDLI